MMKMNSKRICSVIAGACLLAAAVSGCATGTSRVPGRNAAGTTVQNQGYQRSLVNATTNARNNMFGTTGTMYGNNMYGTTGMMYGNNMYGTTGALHGNNMYGTTGALYGNNMYGTTGALYGNNMYGTTGLYGQNNVDGNGLSGRTGTANVNLTSKFDLRRANNIRAQIMRMNGVRNCNVVVNGNTCLVGITPTNGTANQTALKNSIANMVTKSDKTVTNCKVSESGDVMNRISRLSSDINANKNTVADEFNRLINMIR